MRVLSFIPAFLLAAASFVAAAPTTVPTDTSCVTGGSGDDSSVQGVIAIIASATTTISPLSDKLANLKADSGSCTPDALHGIVVDIDAAVTTCIHQLQATAQISLDGVFLGHLCVEIYGLLELLITVVGNLVACIFIIGVGALATIQAVVCALLNDITALVGCLKVYAVGSVAGAITPVIAIVCASVDVCLAFFVGVKV